MAEDRMGLHIVYFHYGCYSHTTKSCLEKIEKLKAIIVVHRDAGQSFRTTSKAEVIVEVGNAEATGAIRQLCVNPMNIKSGADSSWVKVDGNIFGPWIMVNRQQRVTKNKGLRVGGKMSSVGEPNKFIVLNLICEEKEHENKNVDMLPLVYESGPQV